MKYLLIALALLSTQAEAKRLLCIVNADRGYSSIFVETDQAYKQDKETWYFKEKKGDVGFTYIIDKRNNKGLLNQIDIPNRKVIKEANLSCNPTS